MRATHPIHPLWALLLLSGAQVFGQNPPSPVSPPPAPTTAEAASTPAPNKKARPFSAHTASALSAGITYQPPPAQPPPVEIDESDIPRNEIIRLPRHVVRERPPIFTERDLYTEENIKKLAARRYLNPGAQKFFTPFRIGNLDEEYALMLYEADERKRAMAEFAEKASLYRQSGDDAAAAALEDDVQRTFMRRGSSNTQSSKDDTPTGSMLKVLQNK